MNADAFRHFYNYHFAENRKVWEHVASLSFEQFTQKVDYSRGSVREQLVHLLDAEDMWFSELRGDQPLEPLPETVEADDRNVIRAHWDKVEQNIRAYLAELQDDVLFTKPIKEPEEDQVLFAWQVLLHVEFSLPGRCCSMWRTMPPIIVRNSCAPCMIWAWTRNLRITFFTCTKINDHG